MSAPFFSRNVTAAAFAYIESIASTDAAFREQHRSHFLRMLKLPTDIGDGIALQLAQYATDPRRHTYVGATGADRRDPCMVCRSTDRYDVRHGGILAQELSTDIGG